MSVTVLPADLPQAGIGEAEANALVSGLAGHGAARLGAPNALAHMDPPGAAIASLLAEQVARANQNLLHPATSPFASEAERLILSWIAPVFGMAWGQMCSGSSIANLTALWAAREAGASCVVASTEAHVSVAKSARILGMPMYGVATDHLGRLDRCRLPDLSRAALVLTAGTTGRGVVDNLTRAGALWVHVDAAWAGPLRFTRFAPVLDRIDAADSVAVSAHKLLFQPKGSAFVLFRDRAVEPSITYGSSYLERSNVGVEGTRGASAIPLMATLLAWGRQGLASRIEGCMGLAFALARRLDDDPRARLLQRPETGVVNWEPVTSNVDALLRTLRGTSSSVIVNGRRWVRQVSANPEADLERVWERLDDALG